MKKIIFYLMIVGIISFSIAEEDFKGFKQNIYALKVKFSPKRILTKAKRYKPIVEIHANEYKLLPAY